MDLVTVIKDIEQDIFTTKSMRQESLADARASHENFFRDVRGNT